MPSNGRYQFPRSRRERGSRRHRGRHKELTLSDAYARLEPTLIPMLRPLCPACQRRMMFTCIEPGCDRPDLRIFECSKCGHVYNEPGEDAIKLAR